MSAYTLDSVAIGVALTSDGVRVILTLEERHYALLDQQGHTIGLGLLRAATMARTIERLMDALAAANVPPQVALDILEQLAQHPDEDDEDDAATSENNAAVAAIRAALRGREFQA